VSVSPAAAVASVAPSAGVFTIRAASPHRLEAAGLLTFPTARRAWEEGLRAIEAAPAGGLEMDCAGITQADSAGLAVLLDWLAAARRARRTLRYSSLPESLLAVAAISELTDLLRRGTTS
jgi:phospholipid transport system transporter-binding protein